MSNNEYMREYMLRRYHTRRTEALERLGGQCVRCGSKEDLELDHLNPELKTGDYGKLWSYSKVRWEEELTKCQLLCKNCHIEKTKVDVGVPHGGGKSGKYINRKACPCEPCRSKRKEYMRQYIK